METRYHVPEEMKGINNWILWKKETDDKGRITKVPYSAVYNGKASTTNPAAWCSYDQALSKYDKEIYAGIGFVFTKEAGITFIDLDHCFTDGRMNKFAENITNAFHDTYMELSQSGEGIHIFAYGSVGRAIKKDVIEIYDHARYVAFTGNSINGSEIAYKQNEIDVLFDKYAEKTTERTVTRIEPLTLNEREIIDAIMQSKQAGRFYRYYNGDAEPNSENTLALASILAFWCRCDAGMIKSLMYQSNMMRKKFDRRTGGRTWIDTVIEKAINTTGEVYNPTVKNEYVVKEFSREDIMDIEIKGNNKKLYYTFNDYGYNRDPKQRILTGMKHLDYMLKGYEFGCITLWTSATNGGKTTAMTMIVRETIKQGEKVFMFNGEQTKEDFKNNLYKQTVSSDHIIDIQYKDTNIYDHYVDDSVMEELKEIYGDNVILFDNECKRNLDTLLYAMNEVNELYGVKMFVLDNLMQIDIEGGNVNQEQTEMMERLRTFAVNKNVHINLVAHPRKGQDNLIRSSIFDVAGSMNIANKAFNICSLIRRDHLDTETREYKALKKYMADNKYDIDACDGMIEVLKTKGEHCGIIGVMYDRNRKTYTEMERITDAEASAIKRAADKFTPANNTPFDA